MASYRGYSSRGHGSSCGYGHRSGGFTKLFVSSSGFQLRQRFFSHVARKGFRFGKGVPLSLFGFAS